MCDATVAFKFFIYFSHLKTQVGSPTYISLKYNTSVIYKYNTNTIYSLNKYNTNTSQILRHIWPLSGRDSLWLHLTAQFFLRTILNCLSQTYCSKHITNTIQIQYKQNTNAIKIRYQYKYITNIIITGLFFLFTILNSLSGLHPTVTNAIQTHCSKYITDTLQLY